MNKTVIAMLAAVVGIVAIAWAVWPSSPAPTPPTPPPEVAPTEAPPPPPPAPPTASAMSGWVEPMPAAFGFAAPKGATIQAVLVKAGEAVQPGQAILTLDGGRTLHAPRGGKVDLVVVKGGEKAPDASAMVLKPTARSQVRFALPKGMTPPKVGQTTSLTPEGTTQRVAGRVVEANVKAEGTEVLVDTDTFLAAGAKLVAEPFEGTELMDTAAIIVAPKPGARMKPPVAPTPLAPLPKSGFTLDEKKPLLPPPGSPSSPGAGGFRLKPGGNKPLLPPPPPTQ